MDVPFLDLKRQAGAWSDAAARVFERSWFILGPEVEAFESAFAAYCGTRFCVGTGNGTDALELALRAAGVGAGDEVATVANAGMYSTTAIRAVGAVPVYVDVDPGRLLMCPRSLESEAGAGLRAVIATHLYGTMAPMQEILEVAGRLRIPVIEDCAQAHGAMLEDRRAGSWGSAGCFSFYPTKNLGGAGDSGGVVTSDIDMAERLRALRQYGWERRFHSTLRGGRNSRMDEIQAAVLGAKLPFLDQWNGRRREIANRYRATLAGYPRYVLPPGAGLAEVAHLFVIRCEGRERLREKLAGKGIRAEVHYPVLDPDQPSQAGLLHRTGGLPVSRQAVHEILSLPCYPELTGEELECVIGALIEFHDKI